MSEQSFEAPARWNRGFIGRFESALCTTRGEPYKPAVRNDKARNDNVELRYRKKGTFSKLRVDIRPFSSSYADDMMSCTLTGMVLTQGRYMGDAITIAVTFDENNGTATVTFGEHLQDGPFERHGSWEGDSLFWP